MPTSASSSPLSTPWAPRRAKPPHEPELRHLQSPNRPRAGWRVGVAEKCLQRSTSPVFSIPTAPPSRLSADPESHPSGEKSGPAHNNIPMDRDQLFFGHSIPHDRGGGNELDHETTARTVPRRMIEHIVYGSDDLRYKSTDSRAVFPAPIRQCVAQYHQKISRPCSCHLRRITCQTVEAPRAAPYCWASRNPNAQPACLFRCGTCSRCKLAWSRP